MKKTVLIAISAAIAATSTISLQARQDRPGPSIFDYSIVLDGLQAGRFESKLVKGMPYSAEVVSESIQTLSDGNRIVHRTTSRVFRDSQGRVRREEDRPSGSPVITITDPVNNTSMTLDTATKTVRETRGLRWTTPDFWLGFDGFKGVDSTFAFSPLVYDLAFRSSKIAPTARLLNRGQLARPKGSDYSEEHLPARNIEGVQATGFRRTTTIPKGIIGNEQPIKIVSEEWTSADLQILVLTDFNDPRTGRSTYKLLNIVRSEPDPALFKAPSGYRRIGGLFTR